MHTFLVPLKKEKREGRKEGGEEREREKGRTEGRDYIYKYR